MENPKQQLIERLKSANNILVTVSANPSVDQLAAAIGLTLMLNKMGKHGTAVFSGKVPSTIEFLQPEKTIEKNTDSLRDFIIALDKTKADKLRYKVEDSHVKIFITPYRTSITDKDLEFSQGDFNVEVVVALGVQDQKDLDKAITAHGRILHDATTISITNGKPSTLGSIDWDQSNMSSLCEMVASLANDLEPNLLDGQMATALMTGVVAETERFRNAKTTSTTMSISAALMAAGANQQLIATKLEEPKKSEPQPVTISEKVQENGAETQMSEEPQAVDVGSLQIDHEDVAKTLPEVESTEEVESVAEVEIDEHGNIVEADTEESAETPKSIVEGGGTLVLEPPALGGTLTANSQPEKLDPSTDPLGVDSRHSPLLEHRESPKEEQPKLPDFEEATKEPPIELPSDLPPPNPTLVPDVPADLGIAPVENPQVDPDNTGHEQTLTELEAVVQDSYEPSTPPETTPLPEPMPVAPVQDSSPDLGGARDAVSDALASIGQPLDPIQSLNAQPFDINDQIGQQPVVELPPAPDPSFTLPDAIDPVPPLAMPDFTMPENLVGQFQPAVDPTAAPSQNPTAPPTVPPPFMPNMPGFMPPAPAPPADNLDQNAGPQAPTNPFNLPPA